MELHKRKAVESSQTAADLKLHLDKYQAQLKEAQVAVAEKTGAIEQEAYKYKRMQVTGLTNLLYYRPGQFRTTSPCTLDTLKK